MTDNRMLCDQVHHTASVTRNHSVRLLLHNPTGHPHFPR